MSEKTYKGSCHCGAVRYEVDLALESAVTCNCSMCGRAGTLLAFVPEPKFRLLAGEDHLIDYQFASHTIHHTFCRVCGIKSFAKGSGPHGPMAAINVRCLEGVDLAAIRIDHYDGKSV